MRVGSRLLGATRLTVYFTWTALCLPLQMLFLTRPARLASRFPLLYHRVCAWILGFDVAVTGRPASARPTLYVANHSSYLDIVLLGALVEGSFVAKAEVARWPFFGLLAKLQRTVFVDRNRRHDSGRQRDDMVGRLLSGDNLILFPEGTSSDGNRTLPFKSALFAAASTRRDGAGIWVQPVSITCTHLDGIPLGTELRPLYAWYGDMDLGPHLWQVVQAGQLTVAVEFHPPVRADAFASRKALSDHCWTAVSAGVARAVSGRRPALATASAPAIAASSLPA
jgi:1-acyl-sn-glycerol-3-phosphate acyltransferase